MDLSYLIKLGRKPDIPLICRNPTFLRALLAPLLSLATEQLSGRGRGQNMWLSPPSGCLQFSLLLRPPQSFRPSSLVFIQYLFGLAVVEACREFMPGTTGESVRLKWPNDLYVVMADGELKKVGGILVTTNFSGGKVDVVVGQYFGVIGLLEGFPTEICSRMRFEHTQSPADNIAVTTVTPKRPDGPQP